MNRFENEGVMVLQWTLNIFRTLYFIIFLNNDMENIMLIELQ